MIFRKEKTRIEFPRILHWKDVKVGDNEVESAMNTNIVSFFYVNLVRSSYDPFVLSLILLFCLNCFAGSL